MALDSHPHAFRFEGRWWVSELPAADALALLTAQRRWDAAQVRAQRWAVALVIGALVGTGGMLGIGVLAGLAPALYLVLLPLGFGVGVVVGAIVNRRLLGDRLTEAPATPRPVTGRLVRVPPAVVRFVDEDTTLDDLLAWSEQGYVPKDRRPAR